DRFANSAALLPVLPHPVNLWKAQNIYDQLRATVLPHLEERLNGKADAWKEKFLTLGEQLGFHINRNEPAQLQKAA
ncbi:MAG TPA: hypothetical protein VGY98_20600, partial [Verrucomicrobiae bacterium]|nr:hypothetical protein [Verrucomicrobiae bacterium]